MSNEASVGPRLSTCDYKYITCQGGLCSSFVDWPFGGLKFGATEVSDILTVSDHVKRICRVTLAHRQGMEF